MLKTYEVFENINKETHFNVKDQVSKQPIQYTQEIIFAFYFLY